MGKLGLAVNLAKRTANFVKTCGKESILATKPQALKGLQIEGLRLTAPIRTDVCTFAKDSSLAPELLDDLLKIKGSQAEKVGQIKDRFLRAMGYKNPELVKLGNKVGNGSLAFDFMSGCLSVRQTEFPIETLVAFVRHELDHLDKFAKLVKAEGVDTAEIALKTGIFKYVSKIDKSFDRDFWLKMSKDADITNFNTKKYIEALENYRYDVTNGAQSTSAYHLYNGWHSYCANELEKSAYAIQKKVLKIYGVDDTTAYDFYGESFGRIKKLLMKLNENRNVYEPKGFLGNTTFDELYCYSIARTEPLGVEHLKYVREVLNSKVPRNPKKLQQVVEDVNAIEQRCSADMNRSLKVFDTVYNWLKEEKFTLNDIDLG